MKGNELGRYYLTDIKQEILLKEGEDGFIVASCPSIKGCHSQGTTFEEAIENIKDAIEGCLESISVATHEATTSSKNKCKKESEINIDCTISSFPLFT